MIIQKLTMDPFAGLTDRTVKFKEGLNVVLGPNEAGKSTLVNALKLVLFVRTNYKKKDFEREIESFMPLSGGDTIQARLNFGAEGEKYELEKSWGGTKSSRLVLPDGNLLTDEQTVYEMVEELLVLNEGTYSSVLITYQAGLAATLQALSKDPEATQDLISILRKAVFETDGVSVEKLGSVLEDRHDAYFSHWDVNTDAPERGRGIDNQYKQKVGKILKAYYEKEMIQWDLRKANDYERRVDELNKEIRNFNAANAKLKKFIEQNYQVAKDARKRLQLEARRKALQAEQRQLLETLKKWPKVEVSLEKLGTKRRKLREQRSKLQNGLDKAKAYEEDKEKRRIFTNAKKKFQVLGRAKKSLDKMTSIDESDYQKLEGLHYKLDRLKTSLEAGKLDVSFIAKKATSLVVAKDFEDEAKYSIKAGKALNISAGGRVGIQHEDWELGIKSGEAGIDELSAEVEDVSQEYQALLDQLSVTDFVGAKEAYKIYSKQCDKVDNLEGQLEVSLEGQDYEELQTTLEEDVAEEPERASSDIAIELGNVQSEQKRVKDEIESTSSQIEEWEDEHESLKELERVVSENRKEIRDMGRDLTALEPLPEKVGDAESFLQEYEEKEKDLRDKEGEEHRIQLDLAELEGSTPKSSTDELEFQLRDAELHYDQTRLEGDAIAKIRPEYQQLKASMDEHTLDPWLQYMEKVVAPLTAGRYTSAEVMEGDFAYATRADGIGIPFDALSIGTKVGLGLAIRLAMAKYFLEDLKGFIVMDDPLVDLDPVRQEAAAKVIQDFASEKQMIILTCHPGHAALLGGNLIELEGPIQS